MGHLGGKMPRVEVHVALGAPGVPRQPDPGCWEGTSGDGKVKEGEGWAG